MQYNKADVSKVVAKARGVRQVGGVERVGGIVWKEVAEALLDLKCWFTAVSCYAVELCMAILISKSVHVLQL